MWLQTVHYRASWRCCIRRDVSRNGDESGLMAPSDGLMAPQAAILVAWNTFWRVIWYNCIVWIHGVAKNGECFEDYVNMFRRYCNIVTVCWPCYFSSIETCFLIRSCILALEFYAYKSGSWNLFRTVIHSHPSHSRSWRTYKTHGHHYQPAYVRLERQATLMAHKLGRAASSEKKSVRVPVKMADLKELKHSHQVT